MTAMRFPWGSMLAFLPLSTHRGAAGSRPSGSPAMVVQNVRRRFRGCGILPRREGEECLAQSPPSPRSVHAMEAEFRRFSTAWNPLSPFFHGMEPTFLKTSTPWNPVLSPLARRGKWLARNPQSPRSFPGNESLFRHFSTTMETYPEKLGLRGGIRRDWICSLFRFFRPSPSRVRSGWFGGRFPG